jgi:hypothetical protein
MKIYLKFDHSKKDMLEAIDSQYNGEQANDLINEVIERYMDNEYMDKVSQLSEIMHEDLDYEIILFLATHSVLSKIAKIQERDMINQLRDFLKDDEHI